MNTFDEIIQTKAYGDLTPLEMEVIRELVSSEEEYNEMKSFFAGIGQLAISGREEVSVSVKSSLNSVFQAKHPGINQNWSATAETEVKKIIPLYNRNLFRAAALLVLSAGVATIWISVSDNQLKEKTPLTVTASKDPVLHEKKKEAEPKKKFPLNEGNEKSFTAASTNPAENDMEQKQTAPVYRNVTSASSTNDYVLDKSVPENTAGNFSDISVIPASDYFSSSRKDKPGKIEDGKTDHSGDLSKAGLDADLHPGGFSGELAKDYKPSIKTSDYLTLIEPSF